jgi:hypothetical protein
MYTASLLLALLPSAFAAPLLIPKDAELVPDKFIIKMIPDASKEDLEAAKALLSDAPDFEYAFGGFNGFSGTASPSTVDELLKLDAVRLSFPIMKTQSLIFQ